MQFTVNYTNAFEWKREEMERIERAHNEIKCGKLKVLRRNDRSMFGKERKYIVLKENEQKCIRKSSELQAHARK